ncbi:MAG TPA: protealysin inhibitor emfourin [Actinophytocola sp.]|uniref:protealysin inhibitor emfourin n=1 Tax=Actinophytocola sp. TaxID=1872138 RepID=UPI002DBB4753|nr:protealysin inhibitor emfourin [Actinophytocola sp.]HEU5472633.1 protealysin inhibitor emfourin [Actinophytocola sp.]
MTRGGGFAGLVRTTTVDEAALSPADAATLRSTVAGSGLRTLCPPEHAPRPDAEIIEIAVEENGATHTVLVADPDLPDDVRALLTWLDTVPGRTESIGPPG